ncbi:MAG: hypothetical protein WAX67_12005 [Rugosibacter sp.]
MKRTLSIVAASMMLAFTVHAEEAHHPEQKADTAVAKAAAQPSGEAIKKMQGNVKKMRSQLDLIAKAKTDEERQKLMAEHMQTMRENMMAAKGMMSGDAACPMMKGGKGGMGGMGGMGMGGMGMMKGTDGEVSGQGMGMERMQMMEKRMDMMQMKMDAMMKNQSGAATPMEK